MSHVFPPSPSYPSLNGLSLASCGVESAFGWFGSAVPAVFHANYLCHPAPGMGATGEAETALTLCKCSSVTAKHRCV